MPHAALWVVQRNDVRVDGDDTAVSMPHAALWVVQLICSTTVDCSGRCFNAARGFVGGAAALPDVFRRPLQSFNAARGFVGGAAFYASSQTCSACGFNAARGFVGGAAPTR